MGTKHPRLPREHYRGRVWASFTVCVEQRKHLFVRMKIVQVFVNFLKEVAQKHDFRAIYCFMPDDLHLISLGRSDNSDVLRGVEDFKQATAYWLESHHPLFSWQKSFYDRVIRACQLETTVRYVLDNPVRWGLVRQWREYPFIGAVGMDLETFLEELAPE
jgi:REP element-mobilizing transposase RayT